MRGDMPVLETLASRMEGHQSKRDEAFLKKNEPEGDGLGEESKEQDELEDEAWLRG